MQHLNHLKHLFLQNHRNYLNHLNHQKQLNHLSHLSHQNHRNQSISNNPHGRNIEKNNCCLPEKGQDCLSFCSFCGWDRAQIRKDCPPHSEWSAWPAGVIRRPEKADKNKGNNKVQGTNCLNKQYSKKKEHYRVQYWNHCTANRRKNMYPPPNCPKRKCKTPLRQQFPISLRSKMNL